MDYSKLAASLANEVVASTNKVAVNPRTEKFIEWVILSNDTISQRQCANLLERQRIPHRSPVKPQRGDLQRGEVVRIDKRKVPGHLQDLLGSLDGEIASVDEVDGDDVVLNFHNPRLPNILRVEEGAAGSRVGLYRHTPAERALTGPDGERRSSKLFEVVYISDKAAKPPSKDRVLQVQKYVDQGADKGENRSRIYYTGLILKTAYGKKGGANSWYFTIFSQQRDTWPRSLNPSKGRVLYIGRLGKRPSGWEEEYDDWVMDALEEEEGGE